MKKLSQGLFFIFHPLVGYSGVSKKIIYQVEAFKDCGIDMKLCHYDVLPEGERVWKIEDAIVYSYGKGVTAKIKKRIFYKGIADIIIQSGIQFIYIRSMNNANPFTISFFKMLKKAGIKVIMEIPTYPYDKEYQFTTLMKIQSCIDRIFRHSLADNIDKIVTFSNYKEIFGRPTINISNGINFSEIRMKTQINDTSKSINLLGVAEIHYWHGFDRLVKGLAEYYKSAPEYIVYFHIVGAFSENLEKTTTLAPVAENHLEKYVICHGNMQGDALSDMFEIADLGIGSLARHRTGITNIKTLKNREYAARGIPFIYSECDDDFEGRPYIFKVPADESPIDIQSLIEFFKDTEKRPQVIRDSVQNLSWTAQMGMVLNNI